MKYHQKLSSALGVHKGQTISFVGGGGKTSSIFAIAHELATKDIRVAVTTTTHIQIPQKSQVDFTLLNGSDKDLRLVPEWCKIVAIGTCDDNHKMSSPDILNLIKSYFDIVLVEADGARMKPLKAPEIYEPVIPEESDMLVALVGLDCIGKSIINTTHRPKKVANLLSTDLNHIITTEDVAKILQSPKGQMKYAEKFKNIRLILNKADSDADINNAYEIAHNISIKNTKILTTTLIPQKKIIDVITR